MRGEWWWKLQVEYGEFYFPAGRLSSAHTTTATESWFNDCSVPVRDWPANCSDLNPKENLLAVVKRKRRDSKSNKADDLKTAIRATWTFNTALQATDTEFWVYLSRLSHKKIKSLNFFTLCTFCKLTVSLSGQTGREYCSFTQHPFLGCTGPVV